MGELFSPDEEKARDARLEQRVHIGEVMREFCRHPGFKILLQKIEEKVRDTRNEWLQAKTPEECWALKLKAEPWNDILLFVKQEILKGDTASIALRQEKEDSAQAD